jgi:hypothetical protein
MSVPMVRRSTLLLRCNGVSQSSALKILPAALSPPTRRFLSAGPTNEHSEDMRVFLPTCHPTCAGEANEKKVVHGRQRLSAFDEDTDVPFPGFSSSSSHPSVGKDSRGCHLRPCALLRTARFVYLIRLTSAMIRTCMTAGWYFCNLISGISSQPRRSCQRQSSSLRKRLWMNSFPASVVCHSPVLMLMSTKTHQRTLNHCFRPGRQAA